MKKILKICIHHGELDENLVKKVKINSEGKIIYNCKICSKIYQKKYYKINKLKLLEKSKKFFNERPGYKKEARKRAYKLNPEKYRKYSYSWNMNNQEKLRETRKKSVFNLSKSYVKSLVANSTNLRHKDIPDYFIELMRAHLLLKRKIKNDI